MRELASNRVKNNSGNWRLRIKMEVSEEEFWEGQNIRLINFPKGLHFLANTNAKVFNACDGDGIGEWA